AYISGYGYAAMDTLFQSVEIPPTATSATFSYWLHIVTDETGAAANDTLDLSAYRGQSIRLFVQGTENASLQTSFFMDDFSLQVSAPPAIGPDASITA